MADTTSVLGVNLRRAREARDWSRAALAAKSGTSEPAIAKTELYGNQPRLTTLEAWAAALEVSVGELLVSCSCDEPDADPAVDFGMCQTCKRKPAALLRIPPEKAS